MYFGLKYPENILEISKEILLDNTVSWKYHYHMFIIKCLFVDSLVVTFLQGGDTLNSSPLHMFSAMFISGTLWWLRRARQSWPASRSCPGLCHWRGLFCWSSRRDMAPGPETPSPTPRPMTTLKKSFIFVKYQSCNISGLKKYVYSWTFFVLVISSSWLTI